MWEEREAPQRESPQRRRASSAHGDEEWPKGWVWKTRSSFHGWKYLEGGRNPRRSAEAKARRYARGLYRRQQSQGQGLLPSVPESTPAEAEEEEVRIVEVADAESQTDPQGPQELQELKGKVKEALESPGLAQALAANPKEAAKEEGDAAASSSAVKPEPKAPPRLEKKEAEAAPLAQVKTEPDIVSPIIWPDGELDYDPPKGLPVVVLAVPATMTEMPLDAPEEAAPAASKAEDKDKAKAAADPAAEKREEEEAAMPAAAAKKAEEAVAAAAAEQSEEAAMPPAASSAEKAKEAAASSAANEFEAATAASAATETNEDAAGSPAELEY